MATNIIKSTQKLIAIIGQRRSGRTTVAEKIQSFRPQFQVIRSWCFALEEFINLHGMTMSEFAMRSESNADPEINRIMLSVYCEHRRKQDENFSLAPLIGYIQKKDHVVLDDVYYFNELQKLIELNATIIYVNADREKRILRGLTKKMEEIDMASHVAAIKINDVQKWKNTFVINNNKDLNVLNLAVQDTLAEIGL